MSDVRPYNPTPATSEHQKVDVALIRSFLEDLKLYSVVPADAPEVAMIRELVDLAVEDGLLERVEQARMRQALEDMDASTQPE